LKLLIINQEKGEASIPSRGHVALAGDIFGFHSGERLWRWVLLASGGYRPEMLMNTPHAKLGSPSPPGEEFSRPKLNNAKVEKPCSELIF
jgi:hypothetical protein